jgi:8-oxo-dGTP pyrophosphatase MutT (NUDIX family)
MRPVKSPALAKKRQARRQYATLPYRQAEGVEILLVSSRETGRWVLPKGWPMKGRKPHAAAALEAFEEAGVKGIVGKTPLGDYRYDKVLSDDSVLNCRVDVFPLRVERELNAWPERRERDRQWFSPQDAAEAVDEEGLKDLILAFVPDATA